MSHFLGRVQNMGKSQDKLKKMRKLWLSDEMVATSEEPLEPWCVCRRCFDGLRDAAEAWLLHRSGVMPSILNIFGERLT